MEFGKVFVDSVIVGERHRSVNNEKVSALAESMKLLGLQQPISVHVDENDAAFLVAGRHRLEAARVLGWDEIDALFVKLSPRRREMWEIAENLYRVDLSKEQRDAHIRRYAELLAEDEADLQSRQDVAIESKRQDKRGHRQQGIASKVAADTGLSTRTVQRVLNPTSPKPIKVVEPITDEDAKEAWLSQGMSWWNRGSKEWRDEFMMRVDLPVMDAAPNSGDEMPDYLRRRA